MTVIEVTADTCDHCGPSTKAYLYARMPSGRPLSPQQGNPRPWPGATEEVTTT